MDAAEAQILEQGFAATSIERVIDRVGITKGAFFHHFRSKADLAYALVERYAALDLANLERNMARAEKLSRDPLQQVLIFIGLFQESAEELTEPYPGCLFASYLNEAQLFDERTLATIQATMQEWRRRLGAKFDVVLRERPPALPVSSESLADMMTVIFEGAFIVSKTMKEAQTVAEQVAHYRNYIELLFPEKAA